VVRQNSVRREALKNRSKATIFNPELFGVLEEKNVEWARHPELMRKRKAMREKQMAAIKPQGARP